MTANRYTRDRHLSDERFSFFKDIYLFIYSLTFFYLTLIIVDILVICLRLISFIIPIILKLLKTMSMGSSQDLGSCVALLQMGPAEFSTLYLSFRFQLQKWYDTFQLLMCMSKLPFAQKS